MIKDHSPLPWSLEEVELEGTHSIGFSIVDAEGDTVCDLYVHTGPCFARHENDIANAILILQAVNGGAKR